MTSPAQIASTCIMQHLRASARAITQAYETALAPVGLTASQFSTLVAASLGDGLPIGRLADHLGTDRTTLTRVLVPLERRGFVVSGAARSDARSREVRLTDAGQRVLSEAIPAWEAAQKDALSKLGAEVWPDLRARLVNLRDS